MASGFRRLTAALLFALSAMMTSGCADAPELFAEAPLMVFNSYPSNGATVARSDLRQIAVTFSEDLGSADHARTMADRFIVLESPDGPIPITRDDQTNVSYDPEFFSLRVQLDPQVRAGLESGRYLLTIRRSLETEAGSELPTDFVIEFNLAVPQDDDPAID